MGIEQIVAKIIDEAREKAAVIRADFDAKVAEAERRWTEEQGTLRTEAETSTTAAAARERDRVVTAERLEMRKRRLALRRELVDEAFTKAREAFLALPETTYRPLLARFVAEATISGTEEVVLGSRDHQAFGKTVVNEANALLQRDGRKADLKLASEPGTHDAGAVLRQDRVQIRRTLDELLLETRERIEGRVAAILFEGLA